MGDTKGIFLPLDKLLQFRLSRIKEHFFISEISDREKMSKTLSRNIIALDYADKNFLVLSDESSGISLCSFTAAIGPPSSISQVFLISNGIVKMFLKPMRR